MRNSRFMGFLGEYKDPADPRFWDPTWQLLVALSHGTPP